MKNSLLGSTLFLPSGEIGRVNRLAVFCCNSLKKDFGLPGSCTSRIKVHSSYTLDEFFSLTVCYGRLSSDSMDLLPQKSGIVILQADNQQ